MDNGEVPICSVCMEHLGTHGGPASLVCGHNGCLHCLQKVQIHSSVPVCPLCRTPFDAHLNLGLNLELRDALEKVEIASSAVGRFTGEEMVDSSSQRRHVPSHGGCLYDEAGSWMRVSLPSKGDIKESPYIVNDFPDNGSEEEQSNFQESSESPHLQDESRGLVVPRSSPPEVNIRNLLSGMLAIVTGRARSDTEQEDFEYNESYLERSGEALGDGSGSWATVHSPSAPPFLTAAGDDARVVRVTLEADPPQWMPDSAANNCMQCYANFRPLTRGRHHCRFCGGIFCRSCSRGKCLLPVKFMESDPQRVCDTCYDRLEPIQSILTHRVSNAAQIPIHDVTDLTCMRGWLNNPLGLSMEQEIYKATNTLRSFCKVGRLRPEKSIPEVVLRGAKGLAVLTVVKAGILVTYKFGTGLVIARRGDGSWSAPSAIMSCGLGWGAQAGGELTDFIIVLRTSNAVKAFGGHVHLSLGAGFSAAAGPLGRVAEADLRIGDGGTATCYTYSCSQGAFIGMSLEGNMVASRVDTNLRFYGDPYLTPSDILFGSIPRPRAAAPLYSALYDLFEKLEASTSGF